MIDDNVLWNAFRTQVVAVVGNDLSKMNNVVAVLKPSYKTGNKQAALPPEYPYIVLDVTSSTVPYHVPLMQYVDAGGHTVSTRFEKRLITFNCYGNKSKSIIDKLHAHFDVVESIRDSIRADTDGAIQTLNKPNDAVLQLSDRPLEVAEFSLVWVGTSAITDMNSTVIDTVELTYN